MIASASLWSSQRASVGERHDPGTHENRHIQRVAHLWRYAAGTVIPAAWLSAREPLKKLNDE